MSRFVATRCKAAFNAFRSPSRICSRGVADGSLKIDVTRCPLRDAATVQDDFAARKTTGKIVLKPFE
jgi:NADPH:quinone reductase-like Zn-dependent oxidoreductase